MLSTKYNTALKEQSSMEQCGCSFMTLKVLIGVVQIGQVFKIQHDKAKMLKTKPIKMFPKCEFCSLSK